ncbi:MAG: monovalent cation/H+ antiporter subunit A [Betaproteobacteria bacterium]|nr:MAG: monovalent cation/H+ antiporter subunit A [Betaproteobacteria bacterium]
MTDSSLLFLALAAAFAGVPLPLAAARLGRAAATWACAGTMALCLALLAPLLPPAFAGETVVARLAWLPAHGLDLALRLDGLGMLFALLILGIGLLVVLYAHYYLPVADRLGRFFSLLTLFMAAMLGVALSENLLLLVVFWEITSLASFLLIAYKRELHDSRIAARMALAVTGAGGLALLAGVLLLGHIAGSFELSTVLASGEKIRGHGLYLPMLLLVLAGAFTKSAQFPFHFWLPNAMAAPTPVSAYLHSATMVKAGVFLLARLHPALSGSDAWFYIVGGIGATTLVYSAWVALFRHDLKGLLAYSTTSHLGLITLLFGLDTPLSVVAGVFHIINHAIFKASLFMAAGIVDHECGTRDMRKVNGLFRIMPITATLAIVAAGAMAGVPLANGFLSKEMFFAETIGHPAFEQVGWLLPLFATLAGVLAVAYSARFIHDVFFNGEPIDLPRQPHEPPRWLRAPIEVLVVACLLVGIFPEWSVAPLLNAAAGAVLQGPLPEFRLALWHGFNMPFAMSLAALAGGVLIYALRQPLFALYERLPSLHARIAFERFYERLAAFACAAVGRADNGSLQRYAMLFVAFALALGGWAWHSAAPGEGERVVMLPADAAGLWALAALVLAAVGATVLHRRRITAIVLMSVVGLIVALTFERFSAPDLALTQLAVEVVTIVLLLLALHYLPQESPPEPGRARLARDALLAAAAGGGFGAAAWALLTSPLETVSVFFLEQSVPGGGGTNVVNVILVDFRGFDTLGEITVLAMVGLAAHALLDRLVLVAPAHDAEGRPWSGERHPLFLQMLMRPLLPLALAVSAFLFLRGHNLPGGGFVAGLVTGVALILQYLAAGIDFARPRLPQRTPALLALGLAAAAGTGAASWLFDRPFLTSAHGHLGLPLIGEVEIASALLFDLGVYIVVVTAVLMVLSGLGRLSRRDAEAA